jgi:hypothetical protein
MRRHSLALRARYRLFHIHHGRVCERVGKVGIFGEMSYHAAELAGMHTGVLVAAGILITVYAARVAAGEL